MSDIVRFSVIRCIVIVKWTVALECRPVLGVRGCVMFETIRFVEDGDDYPVGTLPSEPLCVITDDMTYQEKIEALSGTIYDYDEASDNRPDYFDYDDPYDYEELYGCDGLVEDEMCYDPCRLDAAGGGTIFSRVWAGYRTGIMFAPKPTVNSTNKTESYQTAFGADFVTRLLMKCTHRMIPGMCTTHSLPNPTVRERPKSMHTPAPDDTEVGDQPFSSD